MNPKELRTAIDDFKLEYQNKIEEVSGRILSESSPLNQYDALADLIKDKITPAWAQKNVQYGEYTQRQVFFFSIEFLIGKLLKSYINCLQLDQVVEAAIEELGLNYETILSQESDPGLGNGGLGRLMACFLESGATMQLPIHGNGIRYKYGLFAQEIINGEQVEVADYWLKNGYPFEFRKPDESVIVKYYGNIHAQRINGVLTFVHENYEPIKAIPYDIPIKGYKNDTVNTLRLWSAEPLEDFDLPRFNQGQFLDALRHKSEAEAISQILYPDDTGFDGKLLRLKQEYFFVCAGLKRIVNRYKRFNKNCLDEFAEKVCIHINDTHPALCGPELMRILMDEEGLGWDDAFDITHHALSFTNHTILPEALEKWPVDMLQNLLPRVYMIIEEINRRFIEYLKNDHFMSDEEAWKLSIIRDNQIHMASLSIVCSHSINGVAELHSKILREETFNGYYHIFPERFHSVTNGVTPRRFLINSNRGLNELINEAIGYDWQLDLNQLKKLEKFEQDPLFIDKFQKIKRANKHQLAAYINTHNGIIVSPDSIFDIQVKRIHEYKRQLLNILHVLHLYNELKAKPDREIYPRTFIFAGKAAPGYYFAKEVIKLIHAVAEKINNDPAINEQLKVVFLSNFNVTLGEIIYPAADISEQISTAGKEASGTGNMKFMMNGAITLGTMDGANIEIYQAVGEDNMISFGLSSDEVSQFEKFGGYRSVDLYENDPRIQLIMHQLVDGSLGQEISFQSIYDALLLYNDRYFVLRDFDSYAKAQSRVNDLYLEKKHWSQISIHNVSQSGLFSSDRSIADYERYIW
ncbi:glycogen/starch/alpha-glucan phosphorylase [Eubacteriaceae bacterium ES3]|nr:glycogen/starch/alpha-glucan phosphorylase [Eubacteriaceae bacterium ES3]